MQQIFTPEILVKHLYNETTLEESALINDALSNDVKLEQEFRQLQETKYALDESEGDEPRSAVSKKILEFSKKQELVTPF